MNFGNIMSQKSKGWACQAEQHKDTFKKKKTSYDSSNRD